MKRLLFFCSLVALLWVPFGATAQDQDRTRDRDRTAEQDLTPDQDRTRLQIRDELRSDRTVTEPELAAAVHEQARERSGVSDAERGERDRERVEAQERERAHERTQTHGPAGTGKGPR